MAIYLLLFVLATLCSSSLQISNIDSPNYIGAVVHYHPITEQSGDQEVTEVNAINYRTIIKKAASYDTDIIVFPEFALSTIPKDGPKEKEFNETEFRAHYRDMASHIPEPEEGVVICDTDSKYKRSLKIISCAAREFKMYVLANHHEKVDCNPNLPDCPSDGFLLYNTNVAFDRDGRVLAKTSKTNLYKEPGTNVRTPPRVSTFRTDFGVTFGNFICADMIHKWPATHFVKNSSVMDVIVTQHWYDAGAFLESMEVQAAWAHAADVNFLASDYSDALAGGGGSGIYAGKRGPIVTHYPFETDNALIVAEIPKLDSRRQPLQELRPDKSFVYVFDRTEVPTILGEPTKIDYNLSGNWYNLQLATSQLLQPDQKSRHVSTICDRGLCCDFHVETSYDKELVAKSPVSKQYRYHLVAFNGVNEFSFGEEICALVSCTSDYLKDCTKYFDENSDVITPMSIDHLVITRRANMEESVLYFPETLRRQGHRALNGGTDFAYLASGPNDSSLLIMHLLKPQSELATFAIFGRRFDWDGQPPSAPHDSTSTVLNSLSSLWLVAILTAAGSWCYTRR
ncbi:hypothetical protein TSAR_000857 [Trichomalopsis sarcophagae]|uniref:CN hydrolase domain-containing protein n=1 Tax=Trichomalopsis sarcophagae TaxID=543379 RepID=A0A232F0H3_9HYME|nr:hypothetical protein TSAR_000857 [Trichomalopsis sarcophagae]